MSQCNEACFYNGVSGCEDLDGGVISKHGQSMNAVAEVNVEVILEEVLGTEAIPEKVWCTEATPQQTRRVKTAGIKTVGVKNAGIRFRVYGVECFCLLIMFLHYGFVYHEYRED
jgi:hypothetical protein